jgi:hypothetical protein
MGRETLALRRTVKTVPKEVNPALAKGPKRWGSLRGWALFLLLLAVSGSILSWRWLQSPKETPDPKRGERVARLEALRKKEAEILESYGWVDRPKGIVRIPLERAMELELKELSSKPVKPSAEPVPTIQALEAQPEAGQR